MTAWARMPTTSVATAVLFTRVVILVETMMSAGVGWSAASVRVPNDAITVYSPAFGCDGAVTHTPSSVAILDVGDAPDDFLALLVDKMDVERAVGSSDLGPLLVEAEVEREAPGDLRVVDETLPP